MTTTVIVQAHCASDKEVKVQITANGEVAEEFTLDDGQQATRVVYDSREISIKEVEKNYGLGN